MSFVVHGLLSLQGCTVVGLDVQLVFTPMQGTQILPSQTKIVTSSLIVLGLLSLQG